MNKLKLIELLELILTATEQENRRKEEVKIVLKGFAKSTFIAILLFTGMAFLFLAFNNEKIYVAQDNKLYVNANIVDLELYSFDKYPSYRDKFDIALKQLGFELKDSRHLVVIDISEQKEYIFDSSGKLLDIYRVSTGAEGKIEVVECFNNEEGERVCERKLVQRAMGPSVWRVVSKRDSYLNATFGARLILLDRRIDGVWVRTDVALHGTNKPELLGIPGSLGCVYHDDADIIELFDILNVGDFVVAIE